MIFFSWYCRAGNIVPYLSPFVCLPLLVCLHLSASPLPTLICPLGISSEHFPPFFSSGLWKGGKKRENRWIKRGSMMKREWDTVLRLWHWQRALSNVQGNEIGIDLYLVFVLLPFLLCLLCLSECVHDDFSLPTRLLHHFNAVSMQFLVLFFFLFFLTAPHEICKDENLLSMSWKRASAGETVYNKCPTNATGQSHDMS